MSFMLTMTDFHLPILPVARLASAVFPRLVSYIEDIGLWMSSNRLKLNAEKTQTCLGTRY